MTKWTYNEEFRPVWARYWKEPFWRKLHPCRCTHGPFPCTNKAVRYYNFLCRQCSVRTRVGEIQRHCFCIGCRVFPVHDPAVNWYTKEKTLNALTSRTVDEDEPPLDETEHHRYRTLVGRLFSNTDVRVDLLTAVREVARASSKPTKLDMLDVKRIVRYLEGTTDFG